LGYGFDTVTSFQPSPLGLDRSVVTYPCSRPIVIGSKPLEVTSFEVDGIRWTYVFYESGLSTNVLYTLEDSGTRAVGFKLSDGMEVPSELVDRFKFARQKSKLAGTIRGSYFVIKGEY
jgi:hypothetical protein